MSQRDLNRAIAQATGEDISMIAGMGFVELTAIPIEREPHIMDIESEPHIMNWDDYDLEVNVAVIPQRRRRATAA